jgi:outer membrane protein, multidrug efflux system
MCVPSNRNTRAFGSRTACSGLLLPLYAILLFGCAVGPDFVPPGVRVPSAWEGASPPRSPVMSTTAGAPADCVEWWKSFNDPLLTSLIERAFESNLDIRQATARIRQARAARRVGTASFWPTVDGFAEVGREGTGGGFGNRAGSLSLETDFFEAGLDAAWELDFFGGARRNVEALTADLEAAVEDRRAVTVSLAGELGLNYFTLRGLQQQIAIAEANLTAQRNTADITRQRYEAGLVSGLDVANANAQTATTASRIPVLEAGVRENIYALGVLLGASPTALLQELEAAAPVAAVPPEVPVGLPSDLIRRRPDIRIAEAQIHAATARIGVATADLFPKFSLTGSFSFSGETFSAMTDWSSRAWSIGPGMQWRIFDAGRIRWNIEVQKALQEQSLLAYQQTVLTALKDVETALVAYAKEQVHSSLLNEAVRENRRAVEISKTLYSAGQTDFLNVLSAQGALFASEEAQALSTRALSVDLVALYKSLGGGWERSESAEARNDSALLVHNPGDAS